MFSSQLSAMSPDTTDSADVMRNQSYSVDENRCASSKDDGDDSNEDGSVLNNKDGITKQIIEEEMKINEEVAMVEDCSYNEDVQKKAVLTEEETAESRYEKLKCLLSKSELYASYLLNRIKKQQDEAQKKEKRPRKQAKKEETKEMGHHLRDVSNRKQDSQANTRPTRKRKQDSTTLNKEQAGKFPKQRKLARVDVLSSDEDAASSEQQVECSDDVQTFNGQVVPPEQPELFTGGILRDYQVEGLNWLKSLYENAVNGILADEMGLGKTIQCIGLVAYLITQQVSGPFFICAPLSTVSNWVSEFKKFTPKIPVILYHGSKEEREHLRQKFNKYYVISDNVKVRPVVITSYGIAMNDRPCIMHYEWKLLIVDEGHRIKNFRCKLVRELKMYNSLHRLLLTGTPLQNDLSELWSLLNFLLPEIFDDLGSFEAWFDASILESSDGEKQILEEEQKKNVLNMIHKILTPFMLRRLKSDVDLAIPPKAEILVYAPLTKSQADMYKAIIEGTIRSLLHQDKDKQKQVVHLNDNGRPIRKSTRNTTYKHLLDIKDEKKRGSHQDTDGVVDDDDDLYKWLESVCRHDEDGSSENMEVKPVAEAEFNIQLRQVLCLLRKASNHPYLIRYPLTKDGEYEIGEDLVKASGKFLILDRMLPELKKRGHKVLIFSQMTSMLDILSDLCYLRGWPFCRLDGSISMEERQIQISEFNTDPDLFIFLLSTRAGGLGINLTAADTVIIYDSDWNPQCDIQAQDRCHRIGQTKPVVVYRLVTPNTIDEKIINRANAKRKMEKMVIHRGQFKRGLVHMTKVDSFSSDDLKSILKETDYDSIVKNEVISDENLSKLLDRSRLLEKITANKAASHKEEDKCVFSEVSGVFKLVPEKTDPSVST